MIIEIWVYGLISLPVIGRHIAYAQNYMYILISLWAFFASLFIVVLNKYRSLHTCLYISAAEFCDMNGEIIDEKVHCEDWLSIFRQCKFVPIFILGGVLHCEGFRILHK